MKAGIQVQFQNEFKMRCALKYRCKEQYNCGYYIYFSLLRWYSINKPIVANGEQQEEHQKRDHTAN